MITNSPASLLSPSLLKFNSASSGTATSETASSVPFEQQLSQALSDSLQRLGVNAGEINISIRNNTANSRQIVITYDSVAPVSTTPETTTTDPTSAPAPARLNPFTMLATPRQPSVTTAEEVLSTDWAPYNGPRDSRDSIPAGGGKLTSTGAPEIQLNTTPARNQYNYSGAAAMNPYFTNPGNPLREGYVLGFGSWFQDAMVLGTKNGPTTANRFNYATEEGAQEALRLVKQHAPNAELVTKTWGTGPYVSNMPMWSISLGEGRMLNAGAVLHGYYNGGWGVTIGSDSELLRDIQRG